MEQARKTEMQPGLDAGRKDACNLNRQEIMPELEVLFVELSRLGEHLARPEGSSSHQIIKMAFSMAEKVLCGAPDCSVESLAPQKAKLKKHMAESYQLQLMLKDEDVNALSELVTCDKVKGRNAAT